MSIEEFNEIVKVPSTEVIGKHNKKVYKNWFNSKKQFHNLVFELNYRYDDIFTNKDGDANLRKFYSSKIFTQEEWHTLLPYIWYRDINKDFDKLSKKVIPLFNRIVKYWNDLHLECWQGIFSFGRHECTKNKSPKESINAKENGKLYCDTLLDIYPIFKEFIDKWDKFIDCQCIFYRFSRAIGPYQYKGLLYNQKYQKNELSETKN